MHRAISTVFVWIALSAAGALGTLMHDRNRLLASLAFVALVAAYAIWTKPGRRTPSWIFVLSGAALPVLLLVVLLVSLIQNIVPSNWVWVSTHVGLSPNGGMDSGALFAFIAWGLSVPVLILLALIPRMAIELGTLRSRGYR